MFTGLDITTHGHNLRLWLHLVILEWVYWLPPILPPMATKREESSNHKEKKRKGREEELFNLKKGERRSSSLSTTLTFPLECFFLIFLSIEELILLLFYSHGRKGWWQKRKPPQCDQVRSQHQFLTMGNNSQPYSHPKILKKITKGWLPTLVKVTT